GATCCISLIALSNFPAGGWPGAELVAAVPNVITEPKAQPITRLIAPNSPIDMDTTGIFKRSVNSAVTCSNRKTFDFTYGITAIFTTSALARSAAFPFSNIQSLDGECVK